MSFWFISTFTERESTHGKQQQPMTTTQQELYDILIRLGDTHEQAMIEVEKKNEDNQSSLYNLHYS